MYFIRCLHDDSIFEHFRVYDEFGNIRCAPEFSVEAFMGICINMRNTENFKIIILVQIQTTNCAHTMTYVSTYSRHKNGVQSLVDIYHIT